jgi:hypothetical protein
MESPSESPQESPSEKFEKFLKSEKPGLRQLIDSGMQSNEIIMGDDDLREIEESLKRIARENLEKQMQSLSGKISREEAKNELIRLKDEAEKIKISPMGQIWSWVYDEVESRLENSNEG